jgi:uncharacterized protein (DUF983 family)
MAVIHERVFSQCPTCGARKLVRDEVLGCDGCGFVMDFNDPDVSVSEITVFAGNGSDRATTYRFHSLKLRAELV